MGGESAPHVSQRPRLSKSRYLAGRQCALRLWCECYAPYLASEATAGQLDFSEMGREVGVFARRAFSGGALAPTQELSFEAAVEATAALVRAADLPALFEGTFVHRDVLARVDVLAREAQGGWRLVEVKAGLDVNEARIDDLALQHWVLAGAGVEVQRDELMTVRRDYVRPDQEPEVGALFELHDLTAEVARRQSEVEHQVDELKGMLAAHAPPPARLSERCYDPFACPFLGHCREEAALSDHPVDELPGLSKTRRARLETLGIRDIGGLAPEIDLSPLQQRVRDCVQSGTEYLDKPVLRELALLTPPVHHVVALSFRSALPRYPGIRPYEPLPFLWCDLSSDSRGGSGVELAVARGDADPRPHLAAALEPVLKTDGTVCVYSPHETGLLRQLAAMVSPEAAARLASRMLELRGIITRAYYHPDLHGSFAWQRVARVLTGMTWDDLAIQDEASAAHRFRASLDLDEPARRETVDRSLSAFAARAVRALEAIRLALAARGQ